MSFGITKLKKEVQAPITRIYKRHMVVGDDLFAMETYRRLLSLHGENEVGLLGFTPTTQEECRVKGPSLWRGEDNLMGLRALYPEREFSLDQKPSLFLKEGSLREFGGRAKSEKLLWDEEYFTQPRILGVEGLLPEFTQEECDLMATQAFRVKMKEIEKITPTDLAQAAQWRVVGTDGVFYEAEHLYFAHAPAHFVDLYKNKSELSDELIQCFESTLGPSVLNVVFECERPVTDMAETILLAQSYTHEWGHYVGEFDNVGQSSKQRAEFLCFIDKNETTEEEISKKIRGLKKAIEKIAPDFAKILTQDFILLKDFSGCLKIDDAAFGTVRNEVENLNFVSVNAPLEQSLMKSISFEDSVFVPSHFVRALMALNKIEKKAN